MGRVRKDDSETQEREKKRRKVNKTREARKRTRHEKKKRKHVWGMTFRSVENKEMKKILEEREKEEIVNNQKILGS